jgi:LacI family transcriptional regulator
MLSIKDIASQCGVSAATVSKALNDRPDIGEATKERVRRAAAELGYHPNSAARALKTNRSYCLGVIYDDGSLLGLSHEYFSRVLEAFERAAEAGGYDVTFITRSLGSRATGYLDHCRCRGVDGVCIVCTADFGSTQIAELMSSGIPAVSIDYSFAGRSSVISDNAGGMEELVRYVCGMGHRRLAFIHGEMTEVTENRLAGFRRACGALGLDIPEGNILEAKYHDAAAASQRTSELLARAERPTCIFFPDDFSSIGGINVIRQSGLSIPGDISCAGYDGIYLSQVLSPRLTTLRQDAEALGSSAAVSLFDEIEHPRSWRPKRTVVKGRLLEGQSVSRIGRE